MKHTWKITILLLLAFLASHVIGLFITDHYLIESLPYNIERPDVNPETSYIPIIISILIATSLILLLIKFQAKKIWKTWFLVVLVYTLTIAFGSFLNQYIALILAILLSLIRILKPGMIIQNLTELFIYGGLAALFVPLFSITSIIILLIIISLYDAIAVWKTKHMVSMAKFQSESQTFAGLMIPYGKNKYGFLGGGDIGFTLLFSGVILKFFSFQSALIVSLVTTLALLGLFLFSKKNKFYPAMPFLTAGCLLGYLIILI